MFRENLNLIEAKKKKAQNDKMLDDYDQRRNAANLKKQMEDEAERQRQEEAKRKGWRKALDNQINEKNQKAQMEKDRNKVPNVNAFTHEDHECCQNGKCCICKRIYPLNVLNPKKKICFFGKNSKNEKTKGKSKKGTKIT